MFAFRERPGVVNAVETVRDNVRGLGLHPTVPRVCASTFEVAAATILGSVAGAGDDAAAAVACEDEGAEAVETVTGTLLRADFGAGGGGDKGCDGGGAAALGFQREEKRCEELMGEELKGVVDWDTLGGGVCQVSLGEG